MAYQTLQDVRNAQPGYLSLEAAEELCPLTVTIASCEDRTFGQGASAETSTVITFVETNKYVTLTKTRDRMLGEVIKPSDPIVGQKIKLVVGDFDTGRGTKRMVGIVAPD